MTDSERLDSEMTRTGMNSCRLAIIADVPAHTIRRVRNIGRVSFNDANRTAVFAALASMPDRSPRDHDWLRDALKKTGATINVIRRSAGLSFQTVNEFMAGISMIHDQNYDTLAAWVNGGAKCKAVEKKPEKKEKEEPQVGMERMLDIIEGRAGIAPETSLGPGYRTSSTLPTYMHFDMPARNRANKHMSIEGMP